MKLLILFGAFFRIGLFGFGGGMAMLPLIYQGVQEFGFMTVEEFSDLLAISQVTPGPIAINAATYVGLNYAGLAGAAAATVGVALPAFLLMLLTLRFLDRFRENPLVKGVFDGIRPVTVGLIGTAALFLSEGVLFHGAPISRELLEQGIAYTEPAAAGIMLLTVLLMAAKKIQPVFIVLIMAGLGALLGGTGYLA